MFFFKKKKLVVDAVVSEKHIHAYNHAKIDHANKFYPDWWKNLPKAEFDFFRMERINESMRLCAGFTEHYSRGLIMPMWSDLAIKTSNMQYIYHYSDGTSSCEHHNMEQRKGFYEDHLNVKIVSPWLIMSEKNVPFTFLPPMWNNTVKPKYELAIGTVNFYYQYATHINTLIKDNQEIFIPFRQPILHLMPQTEREIDLRHHLVTENEFERKRNKSHQISFIGSYFKTKKYIESTEKSKCPFHGLLK